MMDKSADHKVQAFIDGISVTDSEKYECLQELRQIVFSCYPDVKERMMYGGIMLSLEEDFSGIFVYKHHISMEFGKGSTFTDPNQYLEGGGKHRRHLKFSSLKDIEEKNPAYYLKQATD